MADSNSSPPSRSALAVRVSLILVSVILVLGFYGYRRTYLDNDGTWDFWEVYGRTAELLRVVPVIFVKGEKIHPHWTLTTAQAIARIWVYAAGIAWGLAFFGDQLSVWFFRRATAHTVVVGLGWSGKTLAMAAAKELSVREILDASAPESGADSAHAPLAESLKHYQGKMSGLVRSGTGRRVAAIDLNPLNEAFSALKQEKALVLTGSGLDESLLSAARVPNASRVLVLSGDDFLNVRIAETVLKVWRNHHDADTLPAKSWRESLKRKALKVLAGKVEKCDMELVVSTVSPRLRQYLQKRWELIADWKSGDPLVRVVGFQALALRSLLSDSARALILDELVRQRGARIIILGDPMFVGEAMDLALMFFQVSGEALPSFWVSGGVAEQEEFRRRYPAMDTVAKVTFLGEQLLEIGGAALLKNNQAEDARTIPYDAAFIRMENDAATLSLGEQLLSSPEFEVQQVHAFVWRNLEIRVKPLEKMHVTSILEHGCMILSDGFSGLEKEAKGQHEAYRSGLPEHERVKVVPWEGLPEYLKESNRLGVLHGQVKAALWNTFKDGNTAERDAIFEHLSKCEHNRWVAEKVTLGHVYHAQRDDKRKRHPSIVPWTGLSEAEKEKDRVQVRRVLGIPA